MRKYNWATTDTPPQPLPRQCTQTARLHSLDVLKCIAALLVVCIHVGPNILSPLTRCAVPIFFIITGYYYPMMRDNGNFWHHIRKLLKMALFANVLYGICELWVELSNGDVNEWLFDTFQLSRLVRLALADDSLFGLHLWYLWAVLYDLLIFYYTDKFKATEYIRAAAPILFAILCITNFTQYYPLTRNFLFMGIPCMIVGRSIQEGNDKKFSFLNIKCHTWPVVGILLFLVLLEMTLLRVVTCNGFGNRNMCAFTLPLVTVIFYWALSHPRYGHDSWIATIGRKYSADIYVFHIFIHFLVGRFFVINETSHLRLYASMLVYVLVIFLATLLFSIFYERCIAKVLRLPYKSQA